MANEQRHQQGRRESSIRMEQAILDRSAYTRNQSKSSLAAGCHLPLYTVTLLVKCVTLFEICLLRMNHIHPNYLHRYLKQVRVDWLVMSAV